MIVGYMVRIDDTSSAVIAKCPLRGEWVAGGVIVSGSADQLLELMESLVEAGEWRPARTLAGDLDQINLLFPTGRRHMALTGRVQRAEREATGRPPGPVREGGPDARV